MATEVTKIIDPDSGSGFDYDSLYDWEAGQQGDLTGVRDEIAVAKCRCTAGTADTTAFAIDGWTTSATQYIKIWTDTAESYRHAGVFPSSGNIYRLVVSTDANPGAAIYTLENYVWIDGLAVNNTNVGTESWATAIRIETGATALTKISNCILKGNASGTYVRGIYVHSTCGLIKCWNTIIYDYTGSANAVGLAYLGWTESYIASLTVYNCYTGINGAGNSWLNAYNCVAQNCTDGFLDYVRGSNNCSDIASDAPGDDPRTGNVVFANEDGDDFHLASNDTVALGHGLNLYNDANLAFQDDIDGDDRGGLGAAWDIGADQWVPTGSSAWGHDTGVTQENIRNFSGKWYGTGEVISTGDGERIELASGEYLISEIIIVPADSTVTLRKNSYFARS